MAEAVASLKQKFADPTSADMNTDRFDGSDQPWGRLQEVTASAPFLADRRLVIVDNADKLVSRKENRERALELFNNLPPTTRLILLDIFELRGRNALKQYRQRSALFSWINEHKGHSFEQAFIRPTGAAFVTWLRQRAESMAGTIEPAAAQMLADSVADDLYLGNQEISKLLTYVDRSRPVSVDDVAELTPLYRQSDVFAMVDAVGARDSRLAMARLHQLLQDDDPRYAFAMIARQFRLLLQASEAIAAGKDPKDELSIHPYVAGKVANQARNFELSQLEAIHHQLYQLDLNWKTGRADLATALDQLIIQLAH